MEGEWSIFSSPPTPRGPTNGAQVLDAVCGISHVASITLKAPISSIKKSKHNIKVQSLETIIEVQNMDYHLDSFKDSTFNGAYNIETFFYTTHLESAIYQFLCMLQT